MSLARNLGVRQVTPTTPATTTSAATLTTLATPVVTLTTTTLAKEIQELKVKRNLPLLTLSNREKFFYN